MKTKIVKVYDLNDPFFGRRVTGDSYEVAKVFSFYAKENYQKDCGWKVFSYRRWSGYESDVKVRISRVLQDKYGMCYIEMESTEDILNHYWPDPYDLIDRKYIGSTSEDFIPKEFTKVLYEC